MKYRTKPLIEERGLNGVRCDYKDVRDGRSLTPEKLNRKTL